MLPGVELARRRRVHYHGDAVAGAAEHHAWHHHHHLKQPGVAAAQAQAGTGVVGPALAARIRLEEKLRGAAPPSSSPSRWGRRRREGGDGRSASRQQNVQLHQEHQQEPELVLATAAELPGTAASPWPATSRWRPGRATARRTSPSSTASSRKAEVCAVCLEEVREREEPVTRLPCSHRYHSCCVLPWLAIQPGCPCCRTLVPSVDALLSSA